MITNTENQYELRSDLISTSYYCFFFFTLPFANVRLTLWSIVILIILTIAVEKLSWKQMLSTPDATSRGLLCCFFVYIIWLIGTDDWRSALNEIEKHAIWLAFPLILVHSKNFNRERHVRRLLLYFCLGCAFTSLTSLAAAIFANYKINGLSSIIPDLFTNFGLLSFWDLHPTYFSLYLAFGYFAALELTKDKTMGRKFTTTAALTLVTLFFLFLLRSRIILLMFPVVGLIYMRVFLKSQSSRKKRMIFAIGVTALVFTSAFGLAHIDSNFKSRVLQIFQVDPNNLVGSNAENGVTQRVFLWARSFEAIKKAPLWGHGTGDASNELKNQIIEYANDPANKFTEGQVNAMLVIKDIFNSHNQYFTDLLNFGIIGTLPFLWLLAFNLRRAYQTDNFLLLSFILLTASTALTESIMVRQKGIIFFGLFLICLNGRYLKRPKVQA